MIAFHGKQSVKTSYLNRVLRHKKADELIQGYGYFKDGKGCAVGCTIHGADHKRYEKELGIPAVLAYLEDTIFEELPVKEAREWPYLFLNSIKPGADLTKVWFKFAVWLLSDKNEGVCRFATTSLGRKLIIDVSNGYSALIEGKGKSVLSKKFTDAAAYAGYAAAYAGYAAAYAAYAAAYAANATNAAAYAGNAANAAAYAGNAAAYAGNAADTPGLRQQAIITQSKKLIKLLKETK